MSLSSGPSALFVYGVPRCSVIYFRGPQSTPLCVALLLHSSHCPSSPNELSYFLPGSCDSPTPEGQPRLPWSTNLFLFSFLFHNSPSRSPYRGTSVAQIKTTPRSPPGRNWRRDRGACRTKTALRYCDPERLALGVSPYLFLGVGAQWDAPTVPAKVQSAAGFPTRGPGDAGFAVETERPSLFGFATLAKTGRFKK